MSAQKRKQTAVEESNSKKGKIAICWSEISEEREYLEKLIIDQLRCKYSTLENLRTYASDTFIQSDYCAKDCTLNWPKDVRCCVVSFLRLPDVLRLARTCKTWRKMLKSPAYNIYWRIRHKREFFNNPIIGNWAMLKATIPKATIPKATNPKATIPKATTPKATTFKATLWFDIYQYIWCIYAGKGNKGGVGFRPFNRGKLRTFLEYKYPSLCYNKSSYPSVFLSSMRLRNAEIPIPPLFKDILPKKTKCTPFSLAYAIVYSIKKNPTKYFGPEVHVEFFYGQFLFSKAPESRFFPLNCCDYIIDSALSELLKGECGAPITYGNAWHGGRINLGWNMCWSTLQQNIENILLPKRADMCIHYWSAQTMC